MSPVQEGADRVGVATDAEVAYFDAEVLSDQQVRRLEVPWVVVWCVCCEVPWVMDDVM